MKISERFKTGKIKSWQGFRPLVKKALASLAAVALVCSAIPLMSWADLGGEFTQDQLTYTVLTEGDGNNTVSVKATNNGISGAIEITSTVINNNIEYSVTTISDNAFYSCSSLSSITILDSVTSIGDYAFAHCTGLTSITIPYSVTSIGDSAFAFCTSLTSINIPNSVTAISNYAFASSSLTSIAIPNSVTSIGDSAFAYCAGLTSITIPNSVISIGESAFICCTGLTKIKIPSDFNLEKFFNSSVQVDTTKDFPYTIAETYPTTSGDFIYLIAPTSSYFTFIPPIQTTYDGQKKIARVEAGMSESTAGLGAITHIYYSPDSDLNWTEDNPSEAGTYKVKIDVAEGDNYFGQNDIEGKDWTFTIAPLDLSSADVTISTNTYTYTGNAWEPVVTVKDGNGNTIDPSNYKLVWSKDESSGTDMTTAGEKTLTITAKEGSNCTGSKTITNIATITKAEIADISVEQTETLTYTGQPQTATVQTAATTVNGQTATFTYSTAADGTYSDIVPSFTGAGDHTVYYKVTAPNHSDATGIFTLTISQLDLSTADVTISNDTYTYTGNAWEPVVTVKDGNGNTIDPSNYKLVWSKDENDRIYPSGEKTLKVSSLDDGNCTGSKSITYTIANATITDVAVNQTGTLTYNGQAQTATVEAKATTQGNQPATFIYSTDGTNYASAVPSFTGAGDHIVYYKVTAPYHDAAAGNFTVKIASLDVPRQPDNNGTDPKITTQNVSTGTNLPNTTHPARTRLGQK